jgi:hypothetical protein
LSKIFWAVMVMVGGMILFLVALAGWTGMFSMRPRNSNPLGWSGELVK